MVWAEARSQNINFAVSSAVVQNFLIETFKRYGLFSVRTESVIFCNSMKNGTAKIGAFGFE